MNSTLSEYTIATNESYCYLEGATFAGGILHPQSSRAQANLVAPEPKPAHVPQRKARYSDRRRVRRQDVRGWVLHRTGAASTQEISAALKKLGKKLDLRLTAAWMEINLNWVDAIAQLIKSDRALELVGKKVTFREYPARLAYLEAWSPFEVLAVDGEMAKLELLSFPVAIADLVA